MSINLLQSLLTSMDTNTRRYVGNNSYTYQSDDIDDYRYSPQTWYPYSSPTTYRDIVVTYFPVHLSKSDKESKMNSDKILTTGTSFPLSDAYMTFDNDGIVKDYVLKCSVAGYSKDQFVIKKDKVKNTISIMTKKDFKPENIKEEAENIYYFINQLKKSSFEKTFVLPVHSDIENATFKLDEGILEVRVPIKQSEVTEEIVTL